MNLTYNASLDITERIYSSMTFPGTSLVEYRKEVYSNFFTGIETPQPELSVSIYPNPATDFMSVSGNITEITDYRVSDLSGRAVSEKIYSGYERINISDLSPGIYFINFRSKATGKALNLLNIERKLHQSKPSSYESFIHNHLFRQITMPPDPSCVWSKRIFSGSA